MTPEERKELLKFLIQTKTQPVMEIPVGALVCCARAEDYDFEADKQFWEMEENQSVATPYPCKMCGEPVVMSRWMERQFLNMEIHPEIVCLTCFMENPDAFTA